MVARLERYADSAADGAAGTAIFGRRRSGLVKLPEADQGSARAAFSILERPILMSDASRAVAALPFWQVALEVFLSKTGPPSPMPKVLHIWLN